MPHMRTLTAFALAAVLLSGCTTAASPALEPIPGSITYKGQPRTKLTKSPIGSTFEHRFRDALGHEYVERYRIRPDRSLEIIDRRRLDWFIGFKRWP